MADEHELLGKLSGKTKAYVIVNEYCDGELSMPELAVMLDAMVKTDLERIGIMELIKQQCAERRVSDEDRDLLVGGLSGPDAAGPAPARKKPAGRVSGPPRSGTLSLRRHAAEETTPTRHAAKSEDTTKAEIHPPSRPKTVDIRRRNAPEQKKNDDAFFGASVGNVNASGSLATGAHRKTRILVADDDPRTRMVFRMKLEKAGYVVVEAVDGDQAWQAIQEETLDLLLIDMKMPGTHGLEILARLTKAEEQPPVICCSAYDQLKDEFVVSTYPNLRYLVKPVSDADLMQAVEELVGSAAGDDE